jgi:AcrR family transcriptional regulator
MNIDLIITTPEKKERSDAIRNRSLLLQTANALFKEHGVENVTMSAIAEAAQVGKGTLYRHFTDKSALIMGLLDEEMLALQDRVFAYLARPLTAEEKLEWFLTEAISFVLEHFLYLRESNTIRPENFLVHPAHAWWRHTIRGLLLQMPSCEDVEITTDVLYLMLEVQNLHYQSIVLGRSKADIVRTHLYAMKKLTR